MNMFIRRHLNDVVYFINCPNIKEKQDGKIYMKFNCDFIIRII